jgi:hypothetical protein
VSVTDPELVLRLIYAYYSTHHTWPTYQRIWTTIVRYIMMEGARRPILEGYAKYGLEVGRSNAGFYMDVKKLVDKDCLVFECDEFRLTDLGIEFVKELEPIHEHHRLVHMVEFDLPDAA